MSSKRSTRVFNHVSLREHKHFILEEEENHDRTGNPLFALNEEHSNFVIEDDEAESELSSRSFLNRVNDQVRKRQKRSSMNETEDSEKHSVIWRMFMSSTLQSSVFMEKNYSDNWHSIKNTKDLTMKQMFDMSEKLVSEQDEIYGVKTTKLGKALHGSTCLCLVVNKSSIFNAQKFTYFSDSVFRLGKMNEARKRPKLERKATS